MSQQLSDAYAACAPFVFGAIVAARYSYVNYANDPIDKDEIPTANSEATSRERLFTSGSIGGLSLAASTAFTYLAAATMRKIPYGNPIANAGLSILNGTSAGLTVALSILCISVKKGDRLYCTYLQNCGSQAAIAATVSYLSASILQRRLHGRTFLATHLIAGTLLSFITYAAIRKREPLNDTHYNIQHLSVPATAWIMTLAVRRFLEKQAQAK